MTPRTGDGGAQHRQAPNSVVVDRIFRALSDPTRRGVLQQLSAHPACATELAARHPMALPSFVEHLKVLEGSGLVRSQKVGRVRTYELVCEQLKLAEDWLERQRSVWERRLNQLDSYLVRLKKEGPK